MILKIAVVFSFLIIKIKSQENAANVVAPGLIECYNNSNNLDRQRRLPSSINTLIALIRKIEAAPYIQNDRELSLQLVQRFKQDGIISFDKPTNYKYGLPVAPIGMPADKNKIILRQIIPGSAANFPNSSLSEIERCSLHFMLSNSVHLRIRGDEQYVCKKYGRYQRRVRRGLKSDDIETFQPIRSTSRKGNLEETDELQDPNKEIDTEGQPPSDLAKKSVEIIFSDCPLEDGTVYTRWGAVQAGSVINGIASARDLQNILVNGIQVDGRFASTLAGDLAEVVIHQGTANKDPVVVGVQGGWNGTLVPRWYFMDKNSDLELRDTEIRGALDGLIIAKNIGSWRDKARNLKISQILDMFYSRRGVFSNKYRACNRRDMYYEVAPKDELVKQTTGFSFLLNSEAKPLGSIYDDGIRAYSEKAVNALNDYISRIQDLTCEDNEPMLGVSADVLIVLDTQWDFKVMESVIGYLLDSIDVNPYGSNYTLINAKNGEIMVNASNTILDFYLNYNKTIHSNAPTGADFQLAFDTVQNLLQSKMNEEATDKTNRGKSSIVIFIPYSSLSQNDKSIASSKKSYFKQSIPDVKLLAIGRNAKQALEDLVFDSSNDAFDLSDNSDGTSITQTINEVAFRVKEIHRRITNPKCGSNLSGETTTDSFDQYIEPNSTTYYKVSSNYFFGEGEKAVKFQGYGYGNIVVCSSRTNGKPMQNGTGNCQTITGSNVVTFSLTDACVDYETISSCPPMYFSVQSSTTGESSNIRCFDSGCRFPDNIKYTVQVDQLTCNNGSLKIIGNLVLIISTLFTLKHFSCW